MVWDRFKEGGSFRYLFPWALFLPLLLMHTYSTIHNTYILLLKLNAMQI